MPHSNSKKLDPKCKNYCSLCKKYIEGAYREYRYHITTDEKHLEIRKGQNKYKLDFS